MSTLPLGNTAAGASLAASLLGTFGPADQVLVAVLKIAVCAEPLQQAVPMLGFAPTKKTVPFGRNTPAPISNDALLPRALSLSASDTGVFPALLQTPLVGLNRSDSRLFAGKASTVNRELSGS